MIIEPRTRSGQWLLSTLALAFSIGLSDTFAADDGGRQVMTRDNASRHNETKGKSDLPSTVLREWSPDSVFVHPPGRENEDSLYHSGERLDPLAEAAAEVPTFFELDWTHAKMHHGQFDSSIQFELTGRVSSPYALHWQLTSALPPAGTGINLHFQENVLGRSGPAYGTDIPLSWEISIDAGPFTPLIRDGDTCVTAIFTPGSHVFELRIRGPELQVLPYDPGYYLLQLGHTIVPEL